MTYNDLSNQKTPDAKPLVTPAPANTAPANTASAPTDEVKAPEPTVAVAADATTAKV